MNDSYLAHCRLWLWFVLHGIEEAVFVDRLKEAQWSLEVLLIAVVVPLCLTAEYHHTTAHSVTWAQLAPLDSGHKVCRCVVTSLAWNRQHSHGRKLSLSMVSRKLYGTWRSCR